MTSFEFDNVKAEKEDALWRYNMEKKLKTGFTVALVLVSCSWFSTFIPAILEVAGDFRQRFASTFNEPLFNFLLVNFIIVVVYILSSPKQTQTRTDIYDEYVRSSRRSIPTPASATEEITVDKQIIFEENPSPLCPEKQLETTADTDTTRETNISLSPVKQLTTTLERTVLNRTKPAVSSSELKEKKYPRSRSMVSEYRKQRSKEFRRSHTTICGGEVVIRDIEPPRKSIEEMSSEEFQLSIDSFIAARKKILLQENTAHCTRKHVILF